MLVLTGGPERKETMPYAQPRQYSILQGQGVADGVLVEQALAGDQSAFEFLVSRYHTPLVSYSLHAFRQVGAQALLSARTHQKRYDITWLDNGAPSRKEQLPLPADRDH